MMLLTFIVIFAFFFFRKQFLKVFLLSLGIAMRKVVEFICVDYSCSMLPHL